MKKHVLKISIFSIIFIVLFSYLPNILRFRYDDGITPIEDLYIYPKNTIEVLFVGASCIGVDLNSAIMWKDYGIAGYALWGECQPMWNSYFYIKEALKTQTPKVVVLEAYHLTQDEEYENYAPQVKNTIGMKFSLDKIMNVIASTPRGSRMDILWEFPTYHFNYKAFKAPIRKPNLIDKHTLSCKIMKVTKFENIDASNIKETVELPAKQEKYFLKIIKLLKEKNIPLVLVIFPMSYCKEDQMTFNTVAKIAAENNIPFINFNLIRGEIGFDNTTDLIDAQHANYNGMLKVNGYLEKYLKENYNLTDRRNDPNPIYKTWQAYTDKTIPEKVCVSR